MPSFEPEIPSGQPPGPRYLWPREQVFQPPVLPAGIGRLHGMWLAVNSIRDYERVLARHRRPGEALEDASRSSDSLRDRRECGMSSSIPQKSREKSSSGE